ncbi:MAG: DNA repair protein RecO [Ignavibacteriales bacterium]|nr:DNA repair protein RecO [Ignavibacteriales bacterium]
MKYRDTSKIVTFYSQEYGKLKGIAKGARTAKNKFGSSLEPMSRSMLVIYKKEHRDLHLISQCDAIDSFKNLTEDLDRMTTALSVIELMNQVTHEEERNPALFALLVETLSALNSSSKNYSSYLHAFRLRLASLFGYAPNFEVCNECGNSLIMGNGEKQFAFQVARGAVFCNRCCMPNDSFMSMRNESVAFVSISAQGLQIVRRLLNAQMSSLGNLEFDMQVGNQIDELLRLYLRYHFEGLKPLKSTELFHQYNKAVI